MKTAENSIESYISKLLSPRTEAEIKGIHEALGDVIINPIDLYNCTLISESHPLKIDALRIIEGFEAITNGMDHPNVMEELEAVTDESPFSQWKYFCLAVKDLYNGDEESALIKMGNISSTSPLHAMKELFESANRSLLPENPYLVKFYRKLFDRDILFSSAVKQIEEALENRMEDIFLETSRMLLLQIKDTNPYECISLAAWVIRQTVEYEFDINPAIAALKRIFGPQEGYRICGSAFFISDPDISLYFFLKSFDRVIHDTSKDNDFIIDFLEFLNDMLIHVEDREDELQLDVQYWSRIEKLVESISLNLKKVREIHVGYLNEQSKKDWLNQHYTNSDSFEKKEIRPAKGILRKPTIKAVQLELF